MLTFDLDRFKDTFERVHAAFLTDLATASQPAQERQTALTTALKNLEVELHGLPIIGQLARKGKVAEAQAVKGRSVQLSLDIARLKIELAEVALELKGIEASFLKKQAAALTAVKETFDRETEEALAAIQETKNHIYYRFQVATFDLGAADQNYAFGELAVNAAKNELKATEDRAELAIV